MSYERHKMWNVQETEPGDKRFTICAYSGPGWGCLRGSITSKFPTDKQGWRKLRDFLLWLCNGRGGSWLARQFYKAIRQAWYLSREKWWDHALPKPIVRWAEDRIHAECGDLDCLDSFRAGRVGKARSMRRFKKARSCCGSSEWIETCPIDGHRYVLGCNFGH